VVNIIHRVGIKASTQAVHSAISTADGISQWWTRETTRNDSQANAIDVRFLDADGKQLGTMSFVIQETAQPGTVKWQFVSGPNEWIGTDVTFDIKQDGDYAIVIFGHNNWREAIEFTAHCSMKWATFLLSLKSFLETGMGRPSPNDIKIDNWN